MKRFFLILCVIVNCLSLSAQFYNGYQQDFGKNRVQYDKKYWYYLRREKFDVYFDKGGRKIAEYVVQNVDSSYAELKRILEFDYSRRIVYVVYNTLSDFRQSNVGYSTSDDDYNIGGTTQIIDNKVVLYFSGDHKDLNRQIRKGISEVMMSEFLFGVGNYRRILSNSALASYPEWFFDGMTEYFSGSWCYDKEELFCQKLEKSSLKKISQLYADDAVLVGQALWNYIGLKYGDKAISNILYMSKLGEDIDAAFQYVIGKDLQSTLLEMSDYYKQKNISITSEFENNVKIPKRLAKRTITEIELNKEATKLAYVTNKSGKTGLWIYDFNTGKNKKIFGFGSVIEQVTDYVYPLVQWHPTQDAISYFYEKGGLLWFAIYNCETKETNVRKFHHFERILDFSYSKDGTKIIFSGIQAGQTDIFTYNLHTFENEQITNDKSDDRYPLFVQNDSKILYTSNRADDELKNTNEKIVSTYDLFLLSSGQLKRLNNSTSTEQRPYELSPGKYTYLSDLSGKNHLYVVETDSAVSYVDTAFHYSYFSTDFKLKNNSSYAIKNYSFSGNSLLLLAQKNNRQLLNLSDYGDSDFEETELQEAESVLVDTTFFEHESANLYKTNFYINNLANQLDFNFINTGYQEFTGGAYDYTQNMNLLLKLGIIDLFEDYRLTGAYRFTGSLGTNEYLISVENLRKRLDRQYVFHRQSGLTYGTNSSRYYQRIQDNNFLCRFRYPLNQLNSLSVNPNFRYVRNITLATDMNSLAEPNDDEFWVGLSCNYVFDNVRKRDLNIYEGTRSKVFLEGYSQLNKSDSYLCVFGFDFRHYQKIHRNLIVASRIAYSSSFGTSPLLYYLGAVDNWINLFGKNSLYNSSIEYDHTVDWAYQAIGTNMRGFSQNIRNGNSFMVVNLELRWPIIQYLLTKPLKSDVLKNFQVVGFVDFGGAWNGLIPGAKENAYNYTIIDNQPIHVEIDEMRQPFVGAYGYGFRTRLFGYFVRLDIGWGYDEGFIQKMSQFSLGMDF
ncbi:MAG: hypothetical protein MJ198_03475 [Bacteroidales bacterium]|nr:hypothetical protein [Bacteroidales bacterium]